MSIFKTLLVLVFMFNIVCSSSIAGELQMAGVELPGLLDTKGTGPYNKLFEAIVAESGLNITLSIRPLARAFREYNDGKYEGIFPATTVIVEPVSLESAPINRVKVFLFTAPNTTPIKSIDAIRGKRVGIVRGMDYPEIIVTAPVKFDFVTDEITNIKMLLGGRIDAFFGTMPDVFLAIEKMGGNIHLSVDTSVYYMDNRDCFVLLDKPEYRFIINTLNEKIKKLRENGTIQEILGPALVE